MKITNNLTYEKLVHHTGKTIHLTIFKQGCLKSTLLLSKISEAINPYGENNHIGEGSSIDEFLEKQKGVRFIINGGFNHYKKNFYNWKNQDFNIGDPVGVVKIREHYFEDYIDIEHYGFFTQENKNSLWIISNTVNNNNKYILGCTPLLIFNGFKKDIPDRLLQPINNGQINPPSVLGHGKQLHPRTAVGIKDDYIYFIIIENGFTLLQLQEFGLELKVESLLNLDGGGSSQFRLYNEKAYIKNNIHQEDENRILGNAIVLFDERLK